MLSLSSLLFLATTAAAHASVPTDSKFSLKSTFNPVESVLDLPLLHRSASRSAGVYRRACDYQAIAVAHLTANIPYFTASDTVLTNLYTDPDSGATHVYYGQYYLPYSSDLLGFAGASVHIKSNCEVFTYTNALLDFTSFPQARSSTPAISPEKALKAVKDSGTNLGLDDFTAVEHNGDIVFEGVKGVTQVRYIPLIARLLLTTCRT